MTAAHPSLGDESQPIAATNELTFASVPPKLLFSMSDITLNDLRRFVIRSGVEVAYQDAAGRKCLMDIKGIVRIPGIGAPPAFTVDQVLAEATRFVVIPTNPKDEQHTLDRTAMAEAIKATAPASSAAATKEE